MKKMLRALKLSAQSNTRNRLLIIQLATNKTREFSAVFKYIDSKKLKEFSSEYKALIDKLK